MSPLLYSEELQHESGEPSTHQYSAHHNHQGGREYELPRLALRVPDGQGKRNGTTETGKHQHVLETKLYFLGSTEVEEEGEDVDVDDTTGKNGHLSHTFRQGFISHNTCLLPGTKSFGTMPILVVAVL